MTEWEQARFVLNTPLHAFPLIFIQSIVSFFLYLLFVFLFIKLADCLNCTSIQKHMFCVSKQSPVSVTGLATIEVM